MKRALLTVAYVALLMPVTMAEVSAQSRLQGKPGAPPVIQPTPGRISYGLSVKVSKKAPMYETDVFWMYTNGTGKFQLTPQNGYHEWCAVWSPDGARLAHLRRPVTAGILSDTLWTIGSNGLDAVQVIGTPTDLGMPAWSPDGTYLAVQEGPVSAVFRLVLVQPDGTGLCHAVTCGSATPTPGQLGSIITWSPDLEGADGYQGYVLFGYIAPSGEWEVRGLRVTIVDGVLGFPAGTELAGTASVLPPGATSRCVWSPDGQRLAWSSGGLIRVADVPHDASGVPVLPIDPATAWTGYPVGHSVWAWSPDGQSFVGNSVDTGGNPTGVYRFAVPSVLFPGGVPAPGPTPVKLGGDAGDHPQWSPAVVP